MKYKHFFWSLFGLVIWGCSDILVPDISEDSVYLVVPPADLVTADSTQTFRWDFLADAEEYNIQIVGPSFDSIQQIIIDTTIIDNRLTVTLPKGAFEWNVVAFNSAWTSLVSETRVITIE